METEVKGYRLLAVVTLYQPHIGNVAQNILSYIDNVDTLIVWDNSPLSEQVRQRLTEELPSCNNIIWHSDGDNKYIAKAINYSWNIMKEQGYNLLLVMDQDSSWNNFSAYRKDAENVFAKNKESGAIAPFVPSVDRWKVNDILHQVRFFINSGTIISLESLNAIGGADEKFPLDGLDMDLSIRIQKAGKKLFCLTNHNLTHQLGHPRRHKWLPLGTNDYSTARTYTITKGHTLCLRRHFKWLTWNERWKVIKEVILYKPLTIVIMEEQKRMRLTAYIKGLIHGFIY